MQFTIVHFTMKNQSVSDVVAHPAIIHHSLQVIVSFKAQKSKLYVLFSLHNLMRTICVHITLPLRSHITLTHWSFGDEFKEKI